MLSLLQAVQVCRHNLETADSWSQQSPPRDSVAQLHTELVEKKRLFVYKTNPPMDVLGGLGENFFF